MSGDITATAGRYGNWIKPRTAGVFGLGTLGSVIGLAGLIITVISSVIFNIGAGAIILLLFAVVVGPLAYKNSDGRNGWQATGARVSFFKAKLTRRNVYAPERQDELAFAAPPRLPGLLGRSELIEVDADDGGTFAVVVFNGQQQHYSIVIRTDPEGTQLVDPATIDGWVANWGDFLKLCGEEEQVVGVSATVETAPEPGHSVDAEVDRIMSPDAPELSRDMLTQAAADYSTDAAEVITWVSITWTGRTRDRRRMSRDDVIDMICHRLPGLLEALNASGAGSAVVMTPSEVAERVRIAYDPACATTFAQAAAQGEYLDVPWDEVGEPVIENWDSLRHGDVTSTTWRMTAAPRSVVLATVLEPLLRAPRPGDLVRKRVTLLYRPHTVEEASRIADNDMLVAQSNSKKRNGAAKAEDVRARVLAEQTAAEQAAGAGMIRFSILVTATVEPGQTRRADAVVSQLGTTSRIRLRKATGSQSAAFQATLGIGLVLSAYTRVPSSVRDQL